MSLQPGFLGRAASLSHASNPCAHRGDELVLFLNEMKVATVLKKDQL